MSLKFLSQCQFNNLEQYNKLPGVVVTLALVDFDDCIHARYVQYNHIPTKIPVIQLTTHEGTYTENFQSLQDLDAWLITYFGVIKMTEAGLLKS